MSKQPQASRCKLRTSSLGHWVEGQQQKVGAVAQRRGHGKGGKQGGEPKNKE